MIRNQIIKKYQDAREHYNSKAEQPTCMLMIQITVPNRLKIFRK